MSGCLSPVINSFVGGVYQVPEDVFDGFIVYGCRSVGVLTEFYGRIGDVRLAGDHGKYEFSNGLAVPKA